MKLYLSKGRIWTGRQDDAKAAQGGNDYELIEVPTDKPTLLTWLNENWNSRQVEESTSYLSGCMEFTEQQAQPVEPSEPVRAHQGDLSEQIMQLEGSELLNVLQSAIDRLHETAGSKGWGAFAQHAKAHGSASLATDRGIGMLVLAGLTGNLKEVT